MGQDLETSDGSKPSFLIWALRDKNSAPLQRVQIIKGWVDRITGKPYEEVIDIMCSDGLLPDPETNRCPDNGALVDISDCSISSDVGANELKTVWTDDSFNPSVKAFYYVRVLENPTCRWSTWDAVKAGVEPREDLQKTIDEFSPDIIFWSALSSHIHGEGEYVNIQYGDLLVGKINTTAKRIAGGLQPTADPEGAASRFSNIDFFIRGESELVLAEIAEKIDRDENITDVDGLIWKKDNKIQINHPQKIISNMDQIGSYDYSVFEDKVFFRPYNGKVLRAVDLSLIHI